MGVIGSKTTYTVNLTYDLFQNINVAEQQLIIIVILSNMNQDGFSYSAF